MKIQRSTLILALVAFGLSSGIYLQQRLANNPVAEVREAGAEPLFAFDESEIAQFTIRRPDLTLSLEKRAPANSGDAVADLEAETAAAAQPDWSITAPEQTPASDGAVAFLLNLLATGDRRDSFSITNDGQPQAETQQRLGEFGLDQPLAQVELTLADGSRHQLILGNSNFDSSGIYAVKDTNASSDEIEIFLVNSSLEPAVLRPLEEWRYTAELPDEDSEEDADSAGSAVDPEKDASAATELDAAEGEVELPVVNLEAGNNPVEAVVEESVEELSDEAVEIPATE